MMAPLELGPKIVCVCVISNGQAGGPARGKKQQLRRLIGLKWSRRRTARGGDGGPERLSGPAALLRLIGAADCLELEAPAFRGAAACRSSSGSLFPPAIVLAGTSPGAGQKTRRAEQRSRPLRT